MWDIKSGVPRTTIFEPFKYGVEALDVTNDGEYIVAISNEPEKQN